MHDRGDLLTYCPAHDSGDPGYPPDECSFCIFSGDHYDSLAAMLDVERVLDALHIARHQTRTTPVPSAESIRHGYACKTTTCREEMRRETRIFIEAMRGKER
jgi:hypothetical protein